LQKDQKQKRNRILLDKTKYEGVFLYKGRNPATKADYPGNVYGEKNFTFSGKRYRVWNPNRSKLGAAIMNKIKIAPIRPGNSVLYLGCSSGTTPSHVSDLAGREGIVYVLDFAPRMIRDIIFVCQNRTNMMPILANASTPEEYSFVGQVDVVYQDIAQPDQAEILIRNVNKFLKSEGYWFFAVKARSIDVTAEPKKIFSQVKEILLKNNLDIIDMVLLEPYEKDHAMFVGRKRKL